MLDFRSFRIVRFFLFAIVLTALPPSLWPQKSSIKKAASPEQKTARYFDSVRNQPLLLHDFLQRMPKGGDLHNHLSGAVYAESYVNWAAEDGLCVDPAALSLLPPPCDPPNNKPPATAALQDPVLYGRLLDSFSMRQFRPGAESGHDHFFATFGKFGAATNGHTADMLVEARSRAAEGHLQYMELMFNPDTGAIGALAAKLKWNDDFGRMRDQLLADGLPQAIAEASQGLGAIEKREHTLMHCQEPGAAAGCGVQARYLFQVSRGLARERVFTQILAGFEMASRDPRVVGLNLVMAEDWYVPVRDFNLHMRMLDYLHGLYPKVHITLHAGELTEDLVPPEDFFHVRASVLQGHAERIGHGVDVMYESDPQALLRLMAERKVLVEICLTSNDVILNVTGNRHPLPMYLRYGVPVTLATDDPGVSRGDIVLEYQRAAETYHLSYADLKKFARASLEYSFLPGRSLWWNRSERKAKECDKDVPSAKNVSSGCEAFLSENEKARQQWELEKAFLQFENSIQHSAISTQP